MKTTWFTLLLVCFFVETSSLERLNSKDITYAEKDMITILNLLKNDIQNYILQNNWQNYSKLNELLLKNELNLEDVQRCKWEIYRVAMSMNYKTSAYKNQQLTNPTSICLLIGLLKIDDEQFYRMITEVLFKYCRLEIVKDFSNSIKNEVRSFKTYYAIRLYSICEINSKEKEELLKKYPRDTLMMAKLGDTVMISHIINKYGSIQSFNEKKQYLKDLEYINHKKTIEKLIKLLDENNMDTIGKGRKIGLKNDYPIESLRYYVIQSISRIMDNEELFGIKFYEAINSNCNDQKKYIRELYVYVRDVLGHS